jgi:hypothetical protein
MKWIHDFLHGLAHFAIDMEREYQKKKEKEEMNKEWHRINDPIIEKRDKLVKEIRGYIDNDIPIPKHLIYDQPYAVVDACAKTNRMDLADKIFPEYNSKLKAQAKIRPSEKKGTRALKRQLIIFLMIVGIGILVVIGIYFLK